METTRFMQLSKPRQILIRLCQRVNHGSILNLLLADGEVSFGVPLEVILDLKLDADLKRRPELELSDFALSVEHHRLFARIDSLRNGIIEKLVVHDGIPRRVSLRGALLEVHT